MSSKIFSIDNLKRAIAIAEQIEKLEAELGALLSTPGSSSSPILTKSPSPSAKRKKSKRKMSPEGRARIAAAQRARWAKVAKR